LNITLELCNLNNVPIILRPKMPIGQLTFWQLSNNVEKDYNEMGRYGTGEENWNKNFASAKEINNPNK
jgi:deoxycytidine triphosphate deaminase